MKKKLCLILAFFLIGGCAHSERFLPAPVLLPDTIRQMKAPGFWISRQKEPDRLIMDEARINKINSSISGQGYTRQLAEMQEFQDAQETAASIRRQLKDVSFMKLYRADGSKAGSGFYRTLEQNMNLPALKGRVKARFAILSSYADQRLLPTDEILCEQPGDLEFDQLQNSSLDAGSPVLILHETSDAKWCYTLGSSSEGWIRKEALAVCEKGDFLRFLLDRSLIVTQAKADIFLKPDLSAWADYARMGASFPLLRKTESAWEVLFPGRTTQGTLTLLNAYIPQRDASNGVIPYTRRNIINQAFKLLNAPYGWGGLNGEQDCSAFIQQIFLTFGILLPRNSSAQAETGNSLWEAAEGFASDEKKLAVLKLCGAGNVLLRLNGHIVMFLGMHEGQPYVIHEAYAYREKKLSGQDVRVINRAVVSSLSLGKGSRKGSLLERTLSIRAIE